MIKQPGTWLMIWAQQPDGAWRVAAETYTTDIPPPDYKLVEAFWRPVRMFLSEQLCSCLPPGAGAPELAIAPTGLTPGAAAGEMLMHV